MSISSAPEPFSVVIINDTPELANYYEERKSEDMTDVQPSKVEFTIISSSFMSDFKTSFTNLRYLRWWNPTGKFIFLDDNPSKYHCRNADTFLKVIRTVKKKSTSDDLSPTKRAIDSILNGIFVCTDVHKNIILYEFHSHNNKAPNPWIKAVNSDDFMSFDINYSLDVDINNDDLAIIENDPWTLFRLNFNTNLACKTIFFDKMTKLDNYQVIANVEPYQPLMSIQIDNPSEIIRKSNQLKPGLLELTVTPSKWNVFQGFDSVVMKTLFTFLNATVILKIFHKIGEQNDLRRFDIMKDLKKKESDINLNSYDITLTLQQYIAPMYPFVQRDITIITNDRGYVDIRTRIFALLNIKLVCSLIIVSIFVIIVLFTSQGFGKATLTAFCFILGVGIPNLPTHLPTRLLIGGVMPYFLIMTTIFQSSITQILTVPLTAKNIDSIEQLQDLGHKVYAGHGNADYFEVFKRSICGLIKYDDEHCTEMVLNNNRTACVDDADYLEYESTKLKYHRLHIMKEPFAHIFTSYSMRKDWPLQERINSLLSRFTESGLVYKWMRESRDLFNNKYRHNPKMDKAKKYENITLKNSKICFSILLVGLVLSTIVFIIELIPFKKIWMLNFHKLYISFK